jgi:hypothetical protein
MVASSINERMARPAILASTEPTLSERRAGVSGDCEASWARASAAPSRQNARPAIALAPCAWPSFRVRPPIPRRPAPLNPRNESPPREPGGDACAAESSADRLPRREGPNQLSVGLRKVCRKVVNHNGGAQSTAPPRDSIYRRRLVQQRRYMPMSGESSRANLFASPRRFPAIG